MMDNTTTNKIFRDFDGFDSGGATTNIEAGKLWELVPVKQTPDKEGWYVARIPDNKDRAMYYSQIKKGWYYESHCTNREFGITHYLRPYTPPAAPVREGSDVLDKLKNYIRDELMFTMGNGRQPNEGKNNAYYNVLEAIEQLKTESPASPDRGEVNSDIDFFKECWYSRNPVHENIAGEDMFFKTAEIVAREYVSGITTLSRKSVEVAKALEKCGELFGAEIQHVVFNKPSSEQAALTAKETELINSSVISTEHFKEFLNWSSQRKHLFYIDDIRVWLNIFYKQQISMSKFVEVLNYEVFKRYAQPSSEQRVERTFTLDEMKTAYRIGAIGSHWFSGLPSEMDKFIEENLIADFKTKFNIELP